MKIFRHICLYFALNNLTITEPAEFRKKSLETSDFTICKFRRPFTSCTCQTLVCSVESKHTNVNFMPPPPPIR